MKKLIYFSMKIIIIWFFIEKKIIFQKMFENFHFFFKCFFDRSQKKYFSELKKKVDHSFDAKNCDLSIYNVFGAIAALLHDEILKWEINTWKNDFFSQDEHLVSSPYLKQWAVKWAKNPSLNETQFSVTEPWPRVQRGLQYSPT